MKTEQLAIRLANAHHEDEAIRILEQFGYWSDDSVWKPYGEIQNNASIVLNQQALPEAALVELLVNSTDAMLLARCKQNDINPSDQERAPKTIYEALERWFGIGPNHLSGMSNKERTRMAEFMGLVATGDSKTPSYIIYDFGEGQNPGDFERTFLSLAGSNKLTVPFVQGKFNQGSTGVLRFCGHHSLKLIISKKDPSIKGAEDSWGISIVRKIPPAAGMRSSMFQYLAPEGKILSFEADNLPILPNGSSIPFTHGTYVKLFDYAIGPGLGTNILFDLNYRISTLLTKPTLPIRLYERRPRYRGHSMETTMTGLEFRLSDDRGANVEEGFPIHFRFSTSLGTFTAKIYALKEESDKKRFSGKEGVIFTLNGQLHGSLDRSFFGRNSVKMDYLRDSLIVLVDMSDLNAAAVEELVMPSRDRLADGDARREIEESLADFISQDERLLTLRNERREREIGKKLKDNKFTTDLFSSILKKSPVLAKMFISGERLDFPSEEPKERPIRVYEGHPHPTFFRLRKEYSEEMPRMSEVGKTARIHFETDVVNDYLDRVENPGTFEVVFWKGNIQQKFNWIINANDGVWTLGITIPQDFQIDAKLRVTFKVFDETLKTPFEGSFWLKTEKKLVTEAEAQQKKARGNAALPQINEVRKSQWKRFGFDQHSALKVISNGEAYDFHVNMDNLYLANEIRMHKKSMPAVFENRFKLGLTLIGMALLSKPTDHGFEIHPEDAEKAADALAPVLLPMVDGLGQLEE